MVNPSSSKRSFGSYLYWPCCCYVCPAYLYHVIKFEVCFLPVAPLKGKQETHWSRSFSWEITLCQQAHVGNSRLQLVCEINAIHCNIYGEYLEFFASSSRVHRVTRLTWRCRSPLLRHTMELWFWRKVSTTSNIQCINFELSHPWVFLAEFGVKTGLCLLTTVQWCEKPRNISFQIIFWWLGSRSLFHM